MYYSNGYFRILEYAWRYTILGESQIRASSPRETSPQVANPESITECIQKDLLFCLTRAFARTMIGPWYTAFLGGGRV